MYLLVLIYATVVLASVERVVLPLPPAVLTKLEPVIEKCKAQSNAKENVYLNLMSGIVEDEATVDFLDCYAVTTKHMVENGQFNVKLLVSIVPEGELKERFMEALENCNKRSKGERKEVLRQMALCYHETSPVHFKM